MKTTRWASWLFRRMAIRIAGVTAMVAVIAYVVPKIVMAEARRKATEAGYEMRADKVVLRPWEVELLGVRAVGLKADVVAESVTVRYDSRLRVRRITIRKADVVLKKEDGRGEEGKRGRGEIELVDSTIHAKRGGVKVDVEAGHIRMDEEGRVWANANVTAGSGRYSVRAVGVVAQGMKLESINVRAKSVDLIMAADGGPDPTGSPGSQVRKKTFRIDAERATARFGENVIEATAASTEIGLSEWSQEFHAKAESIKMGGNTAEEVRADVVRSGNQFTVEATAKSMETGNRRMSKGEFSVKDAKVWAIVVKDGDYFTVQASSIRVGGALVFAEASTWKEGVRLQMEMPEIGCQELLDSLPQELVPRLRPDGKNGTRMRGTVSWRLEAHVDMPARRKPDVSIWLRNRCVVESVPEDLDVRRLSGPFRHDEYAADGSRTRETAGPGTKNWTPISAISPLMPAAIMAMEDPSFMSHRGILIQAIENSMEQNITAGRFVRGGSTISMQLAKNLWLAREKTVSRKIQEAVLTTYLEQSLTKTKMMELYLNIVEFGPDLYGIGPAARHYFAKDPGSLTLSQSLFLASLLPNPKSAGFEEGKKVSQGRMDLLRKVMKMMLDRGTIGQTQYERGLRETPVFGDPSATGEMETGPRAPGGIDPSEWR